MMDFWSHNSSGCFCCFRKKDSARRGVMVVCVCVANLTRFRRVGYFGHMNLLRFALFLLIPIASMYGMYVYLHLPSKSTIHVGKYTIVPWMVWVRVTISKQVLEAFHFDTHTMWLVLSRVAVREADFEIWHGNGRYIIGPLDDIYRYWYIYIYICISIFMYILKKW